MDASLAHVADVRKEYCQVASAVVSVRWTNKDGPESHSMLLVWASRLSFGEWLGLAIVDCPRMRRSGWTGSWRPPGVRPRESGEFIR